MAVTTNQVLTKKDEGGLQSFPVASGETIYQNTIVIVDSDGYLYNADAAAIGGGKIVAITSDNSANASGPAATTANGSISGAKEESSAVAGDKTVRVCWTTGKFKLTGSGFSQASVGSTAYATDNFTINATGGSGIAIGTITEYISSTTVYVDINKYYNANGIIVQLIPLTATTTHAAGDTISWTPGVRSYLMDMVLDVTTPATGVATIDIGVAANGTTASDILFDGTDIGTAAIYTTAMEQLIAATGNAAGSQVIGATQYITGDASASTAGLVGTARVIYILA